MKRKIDLRKDEKVDKKQSLEASKAIKEIKMPEIKETFADPKYDITFKMLFASEVNKDILISLLNSLLGFKGSKEITEVEINSNELPVSPFSTKKGESGVTSSVDIFCTNRGKQKNSYRDATPKNKIFFSS